MNEQGSFNSTLHDWVDIETRSLDVVASWESLCDTYEALRFVDTISDVARLEEFKWIIKEMNKFLTRTRKTLLTCQDASSMIVVLQKDLTPTGAMNLDGRKNLVYQKLRQRWITRTIATLRQYEEGQEDGWTESGDAGDSGESDYS